MLQPLLPSGAYFTQYNNAEIGGGTIIKKSQKTTLKTRHLLSQLI